MRKVNPGDMPVILLGLSGPTMQLSKLDEYAENLMAQRISSRFEARGYSPSEFNLRMTREEIGCYLGMKLETVSRMFSRFHRESLVETRGKRVRIIDAQALARV